MTKLDPIPAPAAPATTSFDLVELGRAMAHVLEEEGNVKTVFGPPMKLDTRTIVPVARVSMGGGVGGARVLGAAVDAVRGLLGRTRSTKVAPSRALAGGGGVGVEIRPIGFLAEEDGHVVFKRIDAARDEPTRARGET